MGKPLPWKEEERIRIYYDLDDEPEQEQEQEQEQPTLSASEYATYMDYLLGVFSQRYFFPLLALHRALSDSDEEKDEEELGPAPELQNMAHFRS